MVSLGHYALINRLPVDLLVAINSKWYSYVAGDYSKNAYEVSNLRRFKILRALK